MRMTWLFEIPTKISPFLLPLSLKQNQSKNAPILLNCIYRILEFIEFSMIDRTSNIVQELGILFNFLVIIKQLSNPFDL